MGANHGLRTICSTKQGVFLGTANPYYGTQLWRMYSERDHAGCTGGDGCPSRSFTDLNTGVWYHPYTDYVISHSLMRGLSSTLFAPNQSMTRGMMVTTLYRLAGGAPGRGYRYLPGCEVQRLLCQRCGLGRSQRHCQGH